MEGFIKLKRMIVDWQWYKDPNTAHLFLFLLLMANHTVGNWKGVTILKGQFITSVGHLSRDTGLSVRNIRTALQHLERTKDIVIKATNKFTLITICTYDEYIDCESASDKQVTSNRQTGDTPVTLNNNVNNDKNVKKRKIFVPPEQDEVIEYFVANGYTQESAINAYKYYSVADWHDSKGNPILNWKQKMHSVWFKPENNINGNTVVPSWGDASVDLLNLR